MPENKKVKIVGVQEAEGVVFAYQLRSFPLVISAPAEGFVAAEREQPSDFEISPLAAQQAGIAKLKAEALNDRIEMESLNRLKEVQEKAYQEAFAVGLAEGREQALAERRAEIENYLTQMGSLMGELENMKKLIMADHEAHIVSTVFNVASKLALREISANRESIVEVLSEALMEIDSDSHIVVRLSPVDLDFINEMRGSLGRLEEKVSRVRLESDASIAKGGCRVESNYGLIDATIPTRVHRLWNTINERIPRAELRTPIADGLREIPIKGSEPSVATESDAADGDPGDGDPGDDE